MDYYEEFEKPKIMLPDIALKAECAYETNGAFCVNTAYIILTKEKFLLGILNTKLIHFFYTNLTSSIRGGYLRFIRQYLGSIPINFKSNLTSQISKLVEKILILRNSSPTADTTPLESEIDLLVYRLYGLTYDEVKLVDPQFGLSEAEYAAVEVG